MKFSIFFHFSYLICTKNFSHLLGKGWTYQKDWEFHPVNCSDYEKRQRHRFRLMLRPVLEVRWRFSFLCCSYRVSTLKAIKKIGSAMKTKQKKRFVLKIWTSTAYIFSHASLLFLKKNQNFIWKSATADFPLREQILYALNLSRVFPLFLSRQVGGNAMAGYRVLNRRRL